MRALLDTNIIIHRESNRIQNEGIGVLFYWLDKLKIEKCIHPATAVELNKYKDKVAKGVMNVKIENYNTLKTIAPFDDKIRNVSSKFDNNDNDRIDTQILNEVYAGRVDILITEDTKIHNKAVVLGVQNKVFKIDEFIDKSISENPELIDYKVLAVKKSYFGSLNLQDTFFDTFREDYAGFDNWFNKKADEICYVCYNNNILSAFLYIKVEDQSENYSEIAPIFTKGKRLKIGTFKVINNGVRIGERFLKIVFDNALNNTSIEEIYVTIFDKRPEQNRLILMLKEWGFVEHGTKNTNNGIEQVLVKPFSRRNPVNIQNPKLTFPFISRDLNFYIVKIEPQYHSELFPDSRLNNESPLDFVESKPHRNGLSKVYISHSKERDFKSGDVLIFYRIGEQAPKIYSSTVTTIGIVENIIDSIATFDDFKAICRKKTVISDEDLKSQFWDKYPKYRPFVINFLYAHSLPMPKPTLNDLNQLGIIQDVTNMPRGFIKINKDQFNRLIKFAYKK
ncbi:PIN domain-containing protein [Mucilaginibacter sp. cycad4]|uniref:PIN domain-containing protein n=1 Tax=Mucilaginibacter sp. cycad4 TaxID=3342096 RepID=UPI002AAAE767|nr:PIN domain-containing protein [Mucilaginibacter gossypii]WPV00577.1 PIN domain-containing protein [Mucilaginibacter gossypii]